MTTIISHGPHLKTIKVTIGPLKVFFPPRKYTQNPFPSILETKICEPFCSETIQKYRITDPEYKKTEN